MGHHNSRTDSHRNKRMTIWHSTMFKVKGQGHEVVQHIRSNSAIIRSRVIISTCDAVLRAFFFFHSTAQLQYVEDSEPVTRSSWPLVSSAKTQMQVQEEIDKKRFSTSAPHGRGATPYIETVEYYWEIESLQVSEVAVTIASGRIFQSRTVHG